MSESEVRHDAGLIALIAGCCALGPMANNMLLPALPGIQREFAATTVAAQTTVSAFLISFAVGILFVGPLSDRIGRRPVIVGGLVVFIVGCLTAALAASLEWLVLGRIIQALGAAAALTVARAVAGDRYQGAALAQVFAIVTMAMMLGTTLSPALGGYLIIWIDWHAGFWVVASLAAIVLLCILWLLPETRRKDAAAESAGQLARAAGTVIANPRFIGYTLQVGLIYSVFLAFISVAPYVMSQALDRPATDFGFYYILLSAGYFAGNFFVASRGRVIAPEKLMFVGLLLQMLGAAVALLLALGNVWTPAAFFLPQLPMAFGQGLALPHLTAKAQQMAPGYPGVAASMVGFGQQATAALSVQLMGLAATDTPVPIQMFCFVASAVALGALLVLTPKQAGAH